ncbi:hypothetical protein Tco_0496265 [Tanacetum coccineum]
MACDQRMGMIRGVFKCRFSVKARGVGGEDVILEGQVEGSEAVSCRKLKNLWHENPFSSKVGFVSRELSTALAQQPQYSASFVEIVTVSVSNNSNGESLDPKSKQVIPLRFGQFSSLKAICSKDIGQKCQQLLVLDGVPYSAFTTLKIYQDGHDLQNFEVTYIIPLYNLTHTGRHFLDTPFGRP